MLDIGSKFVSNPGGIILYDKNFIPTDETFSLKKQTIGYGNNLRKKGDNRIRLGLGKTGTEVLVSERSIPPIPCKPWDSIIENIANRISKILVERSIITSNLFVNYCLYNMYENGKDHIAFHSDSEANSVPVIASVSLGYPRRFIMLENETNNIYELPLCDGSLLILAGKTNKNYLHSIPPISIPKNVDPVRVNLTFRIVTSEIKIEHPIIKNTHKLLKWTGGGYTRRYYNDDFWFLSPNEICESNLFNECLMFKNWGTYSGKCTMDETEIRNKISTIKNDKTKQMEYSDWFIMANSISKNQLYTKMKQVSKYVMWKFPHTKFKRPMPMKPNVFFDVYLKTPEIGPERKHIIIHDIS